MDFAGVFALAAFPLNDYGLTFGLYFFGHMDDIAVNRLNANNLYSNCGIKRPPNFGVDLFQLSLCIFLD